MCLRLKRLPIVGSCQRTSARTSRSSSASPATLHSPASGSSNKDAATARCAATASSPDHRATHVARAPARMAACTSEARCPASIRSQVAASAPNQPRTSTPSVSRRSRDSSTGVQVSTRLGITRPRHGADDGGINRLLRAMPRGQPVRATSMRRSSERGTSMFMSARQTLRATRDPASWHILAHPCHCPLERKGSRCEHTGSHACSPVVAQGVKATAAGARARCSRQRSRRSSKTRKSGDGTVNSAEVGTTVSLRQQQRSRCGISSAVSNLPRSFPSHDSKAVSAPYARWRAILQGARPAPPRPGLPVMA